MQPERGGLYTFDQAVILGKRALCESDDRGHDIQRTGQIAIRNFNGTVAVSSYSCVNCDLVVSTSYPPLVPGPAAT